MRKTFLVFIFALLPIGLRATDITAPVLDLGTVTYTGSNPGSTVFTAGSLTTQSISVTGDGINSPGPNYTSFNLKNMSYGGQNKSVFLKIVGSAYTITDPCGEIAITDMSLQNYSVATGPITIKKQGGGKGLSGYTNGFFFKLIATVTPTPGKGTCTISQTLPGII